MQTCSHHGSDFIGGYMDGLFAVLSDFFATFCPHLVAGTGNGSFGKHRSKPRELRVRRSHSDQEPADRVSAKIGAKRSGTGKTRRFTLNQDHK